MKAICTLVMSNVKLYSTSCFYARGLIDAAGSNFGSRSYMMAGKAESMDGADEQNRRAWKQG